MQARYFKISPLFHLLPNRCFSFGFEVRAAPNKATSTSFSAWWCLLGYLKYRCINRVEVLPQQRGASLWGNYRYIPWMSGTCHNRSTLESGVFFINNVALGTSPTAANGAVMQTFPWRICRATGAAWLALSRPAPGDVLTSTKSVLTLPWLCCT